jgi:hypothetical protein
MALERERTYLIELLLPIGITLLLPSGFIMVVGFMLDGVFWWADRVAAAGAAIGLLGAATIIFKIVAIIWGLV